MQCYNITIINFEQILSERISTKFTIDLIIYLDKSDD